MKLSFSYLTVAVLSIGHIAGAESIRINSHKPIPLERLYAATYTCLAPGDGKRPSLEEAAHALLMDKVRTQNTEVPAECLRPDYQDLQSFFPRQEQVLTEKIIGFYGSASLDNSFSLRACDHFFGYLTHPTLTGNKFFIDNPDVNTGQLGMSWRRRDAVSGKFLTTNYITDRSFPYVKFENFLDHNPQKPKEPLTDANGNLIGRVSGVSIELGKIKSLTIEGRRIRYIGVLNADTNVEVFKLPVEDYLSCLQESVSAE
jgi:hypothetical protein